MEKNMVTLNKGEGTVTMSYAAYSAVHHDSLMLHLLLMGDEELLKNYREMDNLGKGYAMCQPPMCDEDALRHVYGDHYDGGK